MAKREIALFLLEIRVTKMTETLNGCHLWSQSMHVIHGKDLTLKQDYNILNWWILNML